MKLIKTSLFFIFLMLSSVLSAQEYVLDHDTELKISSLPYYSFGKGVGIVSPDSIYKLNIRFRMQNRITYSESSYDNQETQKSIDAQIRRLRLRFDGYVGDPRFTYALQLSFSPGDVGTIEDGENINIIRDAVVFYNPNNHWSIGIGQTKLPGNRQRLNSSGALQLTDRSINNAAFNIDRDFGVQVHHLNMYSDRFSYNLKGAVSMGEGRNYTSNDDIGLAYTGKVELYPFGSFRNGGEYFEGDLFREPESKVMFSIAYQFNDDAKQSMGQRGSLLPEKRDIHSFFADAIYKKDGWSFMAAYMNRQSKDPLMYVTGILHHVYVGEGYDLQASYLFKNDIDLIGRYSYHDVDDRLDTFIPDAKQFSMGFTKYVREHSFKLQTEITYEIKDRIFPVTERNEWYMRFQVEIGI